MKGIISKSLKLLLSIIITLSVFTAMFLVGCNGKKPPENSSETVKETAPTNITISQTQLSLLIGDTIKLKVLNDNEEELSALWEIEGDCVLVDNGSVTALKIGQATVKATAEGQTVSCEITVEASKTLPLFKINTSGELYLKTGDVFTLVPTLTFNGEEIAVTDVDYQFLGNTITVEKLANQSCNIMANKAGAVELLIVCNWNGVLLYEQITVIIS